MSIVLRIHKIACNTQTESLVLIPLESHLIRFGWFFISLMMSFWFRSFVKHFVNIALIPLFQLNGGLRMIGMLGYDIEGQGNVKR